MDSRRRGEQTVGLTRRRFLDAGTALAFPALLAACGGTQPAAGGGKVDLSKVNRKLLVWGDDKKLYGIPNSVDTRPFFWNKMHFREISANPDNPPATWDQLKEYALKLNRTTATGFMRIGWSYSSNGGLSGSSLTYLFGFIN